MANFNLTNITSKMFATVGSVSQNSPFEPSLIGAIVINSIASPLIVLFNVSVIMAVKRRPRLQSIANILLACLAVTDVLTGLIAQPSLVLWKTFLILSSKHVQPATDFHNSCLAFLSVSSCLHLMVVVCERLVAIKFPFHYPSIASTRNIKPVVLFCWIYSICCLIGRFLVNRDSKVRFLLVAHVLVLCVSFSYTVLYHETLRHQKMITTQQLPQEEVERFVKERKAFRTTVLVVGAVVVCLLPGVIFFILKISGLSIVEGFLESYAPWARTFAMINSLLNPVIYCWRQEGMRKFVFKSLSHVIHPAN